MSSALDTDLNVEGWGAGWGGDGLQDDHRTASSTQPRDHRSQGSMPQAMMVFGHLTATD